MCGHMNPGPRAGNHGFVAKADFSSAPDDLDNGRQGGGVFGEFLVGVEPKQHQANAVVFVQNPAEGPVLWDLKFCFEVGNDRGGS